MTVLMDFSQIALAAIFVDSAAQDCARNPSDESSKLIKHFMLNSIRSNMAVHGPKFGGMIIAADSNSWRRDFFPNYKCQRRAKKAAGDDTGIQWNFVMGVVDEVIDDLRKYFPMPTIKVPGAEGDDIIGVLTKHLALNSDSDDTDIFGDKVASPILVLSSDGDNAQLHQYPGVRQYSPNMKKFITPEGGWRKAMITKIVKGEAGGSSDSIPNIKMPDDTFITGVRQSPISQKLLDSFFAQKNPIDACENEEQRKNYIRNETLVSYEKIPEEIRTAILAEYNAQREQKHSKMQLMDYLTNNRMSNILGSISDFYPK